MRMHDRTALRAALVGSPRRAAVPAALLISALLAAALTAPAKTGKVGARSALEAAAAPLPLDPPPATSVMGPTAQDMLRIVRAELGYHGHSTWTKFGQWYSRTAFAEHYADKYDQTPEFYEYADWCAIFLVWAAQKAGIKIPTDAYTFGMAAEFKARKAFDGTPRVGSFAFFGGPGHVGIVETIDGEGWFTSIEGNHDNMVSRVKRHVRDVYGFGHPAYAPSIPDTGDFGFFLVGARPR